MAIDWQSFNVQSNESVNFYQPNTNSVSLNRILDQNPSQIFGSINANGQVMLVNPNGIIFSPTSSVNVGGLVASGLDINPQLFMNSDIVFKAEGTIAL
jgi:filamentous hemagglutinin family protein